MKIFRRAAALFLSLLMLCQLLPVAAFATGSAEYRAPSAVYSVTFGDQTYLVVAGYTISEFPEPPAQEGKTFLGWYDGDTLVTAPFTPVKDVRLTAKYEEIKEDTLSQRTLVASADGAVISLTGILPEDCGLTVTDQAEKSRLRTRAAADMMMPLNLYTYDISLTNADGTEYQPEDGPVSVTIRGQKFAEALSTGRSIRLTHYLDDGTAEEITDLQVSADTVTFTVSHFSGFSFTGQYDLVDWNASLNAGGVNVELSGDMPRGAQAAAVSAAPAVDEGAVLAAAEITLLNAGVEVEPASWRSSLTVTMTSGAIARAIEEHSELHVVHIADDGTRTQLDDALLSFTDSGVTFPADQFSVYAVTEDIEPESRMTVNFYGKDLSAPLATMYVKNADELEEVIKIMFDPGAGTLGEEETFRGWVVGDITHAGQTPVIPSYTVANATDGSLKTIEDIREWAAAFDDEGENKITEGDVVNIRAAIYKIYIITYLDSEDIAQSADSILIMPDDPHVSYEYTISQDYTPVKDTMKFEGWNATDETKSHITSDTQHADNLYQKDDVIQITGNVSFKVNQSEGHWIVFHENGKGGTYKAPQFVLTGDNTQDPGDMSRKGYTFGGWYTEVTGEPDDHGCRQVVESSKFTFGGNLDDFGDGKLHLYAKWTPVQTAPYTVIMWGERIGDDGKVVPGSYEVLASYVNNNGRVNQNIPYTSVDNGDEDYATGVGTYGHFTGFNLTEASKNQQVRITPEGDAVLDLYYDRIEYNFKFYMYRNGTQNNRYDYANNSSNGRDLNGLVTWHSNQNAHPDVTADSGYTLQSETVGGRTYYYFTITARYGEDISSKWPTYDKLTGANNRVPVSYVMMVGTKLKPNPSSGGDGTVKGLVSVMNENILGATNDKNGNYVVVRFPDSYYNWRYHIWYETIPGVDYTGKTTHVWNGVTYYEDTVLSVRSSNTTVTNQNAPKYQGFDFIDWRGQNWNNRNYWNTTENNTTLYHINEVYSRQKFKITYFDGNYVDGEGKTIQNLSNQQLHESEEIYYGATIPDADRAYEPADKEGYIFKGWYLDEGCTIPYPWGTMPLDGIKVYAKWQQIEYRVFLHSGVPQDEEFTWGSDDQKMNFRVAYGGKVSLPTGKNREGWEFLGWYTTPNYVPSSRFTSDYALTDQNVTTPYNKETDFTDPMNKWGYIEGQGTNSDVGRDWITKKLDLYAKWHQVLDGADGINVVYDPIYAGAGVEPPTGHNPPTDNTLFIDTAEATAQAGSTADDPAKYQFECWVVQKWNGTAFEDTDVEVYPGDTFVVLKANAKEEDITPDPAHPEITKKYTVQVRAKYKPVEDPTPTHIWWFPNYPDIPLAQNTPDKTNKVHSTGLNAEKMAINEAVDIKPNNTFSCEGYTFLGWARPYVSVTHSDTNPNNAGEPLPGLDEDDLYLKWEDGVYKVQKDGNWVTVSMVAADEVTPYHDLYAVWEQHTQVPVEKQWQAGNFRDHQPESVTVELLRDGESFAPEKTIVLSASNNWKYTFTDLPSRNANNHKIEYSIKETVPTGWKASYDPETVTATTNGQPTPTLKVTNSPKYGKITLVKHIAGPTEDFSTVFTDLQFTLKGPKQDGTYKNTYTFTFSEFNNGGTTFSGQYTLEDSDLSFVEPGEYIFYEGNADLLTPWGYSVDTRNPGTTGDVNPVTFTLAEGGDAQPNITNRYTRDTGSLMISKTVTGDHPQGVFPYKVRIKNSEDWWLKQDMTLTADEAEAYDFEIPRTGNTLEGSLTLSNIPTGTYTVIEQGTEEGGSAQIANYELKVTYNPTDAKAAVQKDQTATVSITNHYELNSVPMTLKKVVTGNMGNQNEEFTFSIAVFENEESARAGTNPCTPPEQDGWLSSVTRTGAQEAISIGMFPVGAWVKITESANAANYDTIKAKVGTGQDTDVSSSREYIFPVPEPAAGQTVIPVVFTNDWNLIIPTGVAQDRTPYLALLALALLGAAMLVRRRKKA